ncbi:hypothetical protein GUJ93_ZPchr0009g269 [Zizania palustris]|uniref:Uncharacterized protein n=1 Tax=Zizania palustris TaxID=103762 RepID=A0A8J5VLN9_ZIZPA|nr:hypothetical protein GUJ93_ZPchr0009g269 [Zizania palustris]
MFGGGKDETLLVLSCLVVAAVAAAAAMGSLKLLLQASDELNTSVTCAHWPLLDHLLLLHLVGCGGGGSCTGGVDAMAVGSWHLGAAPLRRRDVGSSGRGFLAQAKPVEAVSCMGPERGRWSARWGASSW